VRKVVQWKSGLELSQRFKDKYRKNECNVDSMKDRVEEKGKWPYDVRKKGVGNNSFCPVVARSGSINDVVE